MTLSCGPFLRLNIDNKVYLQKFDAIKSMNETNLDGESATCIER